VVALVRVALVAVKLVAENVRTLRILAKRVPRTLRAEVMVLLAAVVVLKVEVAVTARVLVAMREPASVWPTSVVDAS
jgi:hypothetical protein